MRTRARCQELLRFGAPKTWGDGVAETDRDVARRDACTGRGAGRATRVELLLRDLPREPRGAAARDQLHAHHLVQALLLLHVPRHRPRAARARRGRRARRDLRAAATGGDRRDPARLHASSAPLIVAVGYLFVARIPIDTFKIWAYGRSDVTNGSVLSRICLVLFFSFLPTGIVALDAVRSPARRHRAALFRRPRRRGDRVRARGPAHRDGRAAGRRSCSRRSCCSSSAVRGSLLAASRGRGPVAGRARRRARGRGGRAPSEIPDVKLDGGKSGDGSTPTPTSCTRRGARSSASTSATSARTGVALFHDGLLGSSCCKWDGKRSSLNDFEFDKHTRGCRSPTGAPPPERELIIGARGGPRGRRIAVLRRRRTSTRSS